MNKRAPSLRTAATLAAITTLSLPVVLVDPSLASKPATTTANKTPAQVVHQSFQSPAGTGFGSDGSL
jgi:hypothetical protein